MQSNEIKQLRLKLAKTQQEMADAIGVSVRAYVRWEHGDGVPSELNMQKLAQIGQRSHDNADSFSEPNSMYTVDGEVSWVPRYKVSASAGPGITAEVAPECQFLAVRSNWLHEHGIVPERCMAVSIGGDSMEPEIKDRDLVFLNTGDKTITGRESIFVFRHMDAICCKFLRRTPEHIVVRSANSDFPPYNVKPIAPDDFEVLGRVFWISRVYV